MTAAQAELNDLKKTYACKRKQRESVLEEAYKRLKAAVKKNDMKEVTLAQALMQGAEGLKEEEAEQKKKIDALEKSLERQRLKLFSMISKT